MTWEFRNDTPIYSQLIDQIKRAITAGTLKAGERLPSVRDLAAEAGVNPNTMQRALQELEREGMVYTVRTAGRFVSENAAAIEKEKKRLADELLRGFLQSMKSLGFSETEAQRLLAEHIKEEKTNGTAGM